MKFPQYRPRRLRKDDLFRRMIRETHLRPDDLILFGIPEKKDELGSEAYAENGIIQRALRQLREKVEGILFITDVCLCEYTSHGHCGVVEGGRILMDEHFDF